MPFPMDTETPYSPGSPSATRRDNSDPIQHITIRQILTASHVQTRFMINDRDTGFVQVIANVYDTNFTREKVEFRLDDGTGRIKATKWDVIDEDEEREFADSLSKCFQYARVVGTIGEFRGVHYLKVIRIVLVEDPHEIYQHLLKVMVESVMAQRGPPPVNHSVTQSAQSPYQPTEPLSLRSLERTLPSNVHHDTGDFQSSVQDSSRVSGKQPLRTPVRERPVTPVQQTGMFIGTPPSREAAESPDGSPISVRLIGGGPSKRGYRIGDFPSSPEPSREPASPSPAARRRQPYSRPSLAPGRLKSSANQGTTSTATVSRYQASPQFIFSASALPPEASRHQEPRSIPQPINDLFSQTTTQNRRSTRMTTYIRSDPYSNLSNLQRDIILTIQNTLMETGNAEVGVHLNVIVDSIARRSLSFDRESFGRDFVSLVEEGYIYNTIDDEHFACTS